MKLKLRRIRGNSNVRVNKQPQHNKNYFFREVTKRNGLHKKLVSTTTLIIIVSLFLTGIITFLITRNRATNDFKASTIQILSQNKNYVELINTTIEGTSMQIFSNNNFTIALSNNIEDDFERYKLRRNVEDQIKSLGYNVNVE